MNTYDSWKEYRNRKKDRCLSQLKVKTQEITDHEAYICLVEGVFQEKDDIYHRPIQKTGKR